MIIAHRISVYNEHTNNSLYVLDSNPKGTTLEIVDEINGDKKHFNLPRNQMIETLEFILKKLKA